MTKRSCRGDEDEGLDESGNRVRIKLATKCFLRNLDFLSRVRKDIFYLSSLFLYKMSLPKIISHDNRTRDL